MVPRGGSRSSAEAEILQEMEVSMYIQVLQNTEEESGTTILNRACAHQRLIDDILTRGGKRTGKVRCLECGAEIDDPYRGQR
jgi:spore germination protein YaaH